MPCTALPRGFTDTKYPWDPDIQNNPCGVPEYAANLCKFHWQMAYGQGPPPAIYQAAVLADSPRGYWRLGEASGIFADSSGLNHPMTPAGGVTYLAAAATVDGDKAITLDGATGCAFSTPHADFDLGDVWTIECWVKRTVNGFDDMLISKQNTAYEMFLTSANGTVNMDGGGITLRASSVGILADGLWHHVVCVKNGAASRDIYIDGVLRNGTDFGNSTSTNNGSAPFIGQNTGNNLFAHASIDEVAIYATALSAARVLAHYRAGATPVEPQTAVLVHCDGTNASTVFIDSSQYARPVTFGGSAKVSTAQSKFGGASLLCDALGSISWPDAADLEFGTSDFTIDFWVRFTDVTTVGWVGHKSNGTTGSYGFVVSAGNLAFFANSVSGGWDIANNVTVGAVVINQWYHVAVTRSGSTWRTFLNGALTQTFTSAAAVANTTDPHRWGGFTVGNGMAGWMDEIRISMGIARWTAAFTPPTVPYS